MFEQRRPQWHSEDHLQAQSQTGNCSQPLSLLNGKKKKKHSVCLGVHLRTCSTILDLAGVETLLVKVLHAGKHPCATEAHWIDGALLMEGHSVCDDLKRMQAAHKCSPHVAVFWAPTPENEWLN